MSRPIKKPEMTLLRCGNSLLSAEYQLAQSFDREISQIFLSFSSFTQKKIAILSQSFNLTGF